MDQVTGFMGGIPWSLLGALLVLGLLWTWYEVRRGRQARVENDQGARCSHGQLKYRSCKYCAIAFAAEAAPAPAGDAFPAPRDGGRQGAAVTGSTAWRAATQIREDFLLRHAAPASADPQPPATLPPPPAPRPLRIDIPHPGQVRLEVNTNATASGQLHVGVISDHGLNERVLQLPGSAMNWQLPFYDFRGVRALIFPDVQGIERIRVFVDHNQIADAHPDLLIAARKA